LQGEPESVVVWIDGGRVRDALVPVVIRAIEDARARPVVWSADGRPAEAAELLVSVLAPGERRLPADAVVAMTEDPGLRLLLLCTDELIRPSVTIADGRVVLLGPPLTEQRIAARLRIQLAELRGGVARAPALSLDGRVRVASAEGSSPQAYFALVGACAREDSPDALLPVAQPLPAGLAFTLQTGAGLDASRRARLAELLGRDEANEQKGRALLELVGLEAAVVHLSPSRDWLVHWPNPAAGLFLTAPLRLPPAWRLGAGRATCLVQHAAASGDVLLAVWGGGWTLRPDATMKEDLAELAEAATAGGPRVLDALVERLKGASMESASALVLEVR